MPSQKVSRVGTGHVRRRLVCSSAVIGVLGAAFVATGAGGHLNQMRTPAVVGGSMNPDHGRRAATKGDEGGKSAVQQMGVFSIPRNSADFLPHRLARANFNGGDGIPKELEPGRLLPKTSRLTTSALGVTIYATATTLNAVCEQTVVVHEPGWAGGCLKSFDGFKGSIAPSVQDIDRIGSGHPPIVEGLAADNVVGIQVLVRGRLHRARLDRNAFVYVLKTASEWPTAVVVQLRDGTHVRVPLGGPPRLLH